MPSLGLGVGTQQRRPLCEKEARDREYHRRKPRIIENRGIKRKKKEKRNIILCESAVCPMRRMAACTTRCSIGCGIQNTQRVKSNPWENCHPTIMSVYRSTTLLNIRLTHI